MCDNRLWAQYAEVYDLMAENNPAYQEILDTFLRTISSWKLCADDLVVDLGAGTGNFSIALAQICRRVSVVHVDAGTAMNLVAKAKATKSNLTNWKCVEQPAQDAEFELNDVAGVVCIHSLYTFADPPAILSKIYSWLRPGGWIFACDLGRIIDVGDWARYMFAASLQRDGFCKTLAQFWKGRVVARENRRIARLQREGTFWLHSPIEYRRAFEHIGFEIISQQKLYREYSDLVICRKPSN